MDLVGVRPAMHRILRITGMAELFPGYRTVDATALPSSSGPSENRFGRAGEEGGNRDNAFLPVTIYLSDENGYEDVRFAVEILLLNAGLRIDSREDPVLGSWFQRMWAAVSTAVRTPLAREGALVATHIIDTRVVLIHDAVITAKLMENLPPVISALNGYEEAVIRVGALLIVKVDGKVAVHQLTPAQQAIMDHQPELAKAPREVFACLGLSSQNGDSSITALQ
jgi:hypothetical protein